LRFAICDFAAVFFDDAIIATISPASISKGLTFVALTKCVSIISSSQKRAFICFLFHHAKLGNELRLRPRSAGSAVIRGHGCAAPDQLRSYRSSLNGLGHSTNQFENPQSELLRSLKEFAFSH